MAASFVAASSQRLVNSAPAFLAPPFTVGFWAYPITISVATTIWSLGDTGTTTNLFSLGFSSGDQWRISAVAGTAIDTVLGTVTAGKWAFMVGRFISATNRRLAVLEYDGGAQHGQGTTSRVPAGVDSAYIGAQTSSSPTRHFGGRVGEFWCTNTDIQPDAAQLQDGLLRQLAYGGPFSVPHVAKDIVEYRSLRVHPDSTGDRLGEVYFGSAGRQTWGNTNVATTGPHPPLPYWYVKPGQARRLLTI